MLSQFQIVVFDQACAEVMNRLFKKAEQELKIRAQDIPAHYEHR